MKNPDTFNHASLNGLFNGATITNVQVNIVEGEGHRIVFQEAATGTADRAAATAATSIDGERFAHAVADAQQYFWAQSSWAVIYCVMRDRFGFVGSMRDFEKRVQSLASPGVYPCPDETVSHTLASNPFMKLSVEKWPHERKERVTRLAEAFTSGMNQPAG